LRTPLQRRRNCEIAGDVAGRDRGPPVPGAGEVEETHGEEGMTRQEKMDELFRDLLPSASQEQIEGARWRILERVRTGAVAEPVTLAVSPLNHGDYHILLVLS